MVLGSSQRRESPHPNPLPEDHVISFMLAIGKATQPPWPKGGQLSYDEVVIRDHFN